MRSQTNSTHTSKTGIGTEEITDILMEILFSQASVAALETAINSLQAVPRLLHTLSETTGIEPEELGLNEARNLIKRLADTTKKFKQERGFAV